MKAFMKELLVVVPIVDNFVKPFSFIFAFFSRCSIWAESSHNNDSHNSNSNFPEKIDQNAPCNKQCDFKQYFRSQCHV